MPMSVVQRLLSVAVLGGLAGVASATGLLPRPDATPSRPNGMSASAKSPQVRFRSSGFDLGRLFAAASQRGGRSGATFPPNVPGVPTRTETTEAEPNPTPTPTPVPFAAPIANPMANLLPPVPPSPARPLAAKPVPTPHWGVGMWLTLGLTGCFSLLLLVGLALLGWPARSVAVPRYRRSRPAEVSSLRPVV